MTCLTSQMAQTSTPQEHTIHTFPVPGTTYIVLSARNVQTSDGTRLLVEFYATAYNIPHSLFCEYHPRYTFLTDPQVVEVNNRTRTFLATYIGRDLSGEGDLVFLKNWE